MKKWISLFLTCSMALMATAGLAVTASDTAQPGNIATIEGKIIEMNEDGSFVLSQGEETDPIIIVTNHDTVLDAEWWLGVDDVVTVAYDVDKADDPLEIIATRVSSFTLEGLVEEVNAENNRLLIVTPQMGQVWITLPEEYTASDFEVDQHVRAFYNGIMALSLPGQVTAQEITQVHVESGTVAEINDGWLLLNWGNSQLHINTDLHTKQMGSYDIGDSLLIFYSGIMTRSMPGQIYALALYVE